MFADLYFCNDFDGACCDYVTEGVYFSFVFKDGQCREWNE